MARALTEIRQTLWLGIPMAGAQLSQLAMTTTDVAFVGRLGTGEALAAMAVGQASYGLFLAFGIGLIAAVNPLSSQAFGAGRLPAGSAGARGGARPGSSADARRGARRHSRRRASA